MNTTRPGRGSGCACRLAAITSPPRLWPTKCSTGERTDAAKRASACAFSASPPRTDRYAKAHTRKPRWRRRRARNPITQGLIHSPWTRIAASGSAPRSDPSTPGDIRGMVSACFTPPSPERSSWNDKAMKFQGSEKNRRPGTAFATVKTPKPGPRWSVPMPRQAGGREVPAYPACDKRAGRFGQFPERFFLPAPRPITPTEAEPMPERPCRDCRCPPCLHGIPRSGARRTGPVRDGARRRGAGHGTRRAR